MTLDMSGSFFDPSRKRTPVLNDISKVQTFLEQIKYLRLGGVSELSIKCRNLDGHGDLELYLYQNSNPINPSDKLNLEKLSCIDSDTFVIAGLVGASTSIISGEITQGFSLKFEDREASSTYEVKINRFGYAYTKKP